MKNSLVSIIVPCYCQAQFLPEALQSVLDQTYSFWECIIIDDGSPDNTESVAKEWSNRDPRFKYLKKENGGLSSARNAGIAVSMGEYILPLDADDRIGQEYLQLGVEILNKDINIKLVYAEAEYFGTKQGRWELPDYSLKQLALVNRIYCSAIFRRKDFLLYGPYDERFTYGYEDWDLWLSILKNNGDVFKIPSIQFYYRKKEGGGMVDVFSNRNIYYKTLNDIYFKHKEFYTEKFGPAIIAFQVKEDLQIQLNHVKKALEDYKNSRTYKTGRFINEKFGFFKKFFNTFRVKASSNA